MRRRIANSKKSGGNVSIHKYAETLIFFFNLFPIKVKEYIVEEIGRAVYNTRVTDSVHDLLSSNV